MGGTTLLAANVLSGNGGYGLMIFQAGTTRNSVEGTLIGLAEGGSAAVSNVSGGVLIASGATDNIIGGTAPGDRNVISGNTASLSYSNGVVISDSGTSGNVVEGDYIGTNVTGKVAIPNGGNGVQVQSGATDNTIGGTTAAARDVISGNTYSGVLITNAGTTGNVVEGDFIGTDPTGELSVPNYYGVAIDVGASSNTVGGATAAARDVISGNTGFGVYITGTGTNGNTVEEDYLGTDATGTVAVPLPSPPALPGSAHVSTYQAYGVVIAGGAAHNTLSDDVVSGNGTAGVYITGASTSWNVVAGDFVGTTYTGKSVLGNGTYGVALVAGAGSNQVGGTTGAARDIISGNGLAGVFVSGGGTVGNVVEGDFIGTDVTGTAALTDGTYDVVVNGGAAYNTIGGTTAAARDVISGNAVYRVVLSDPGTVENDVEGDYIGTNAAGNAILGSGADGIWITNGASDNYVRRPTASGADVIDGNTTAGVEISGPGTSDNVVDQDFIGVNAADNAVLGNSDGVLLDAGASLNLVESNVISGNAVGVAIIDGATIYNAIEFDEIGTDATGVLRLGNTQDGILYANAAANSIQYDTIANSGTYGIVATAGDSGFINIATSTFANNKDGNELVE